MGICNDLVVPNSVYDSGISNALVVRNSVYMTVEFATIWSPQIVFMWIFNALVVQNSVYGSEICNTLVVPNSVYVSGICNALDIPNSVYDSVRLLKSDVLDLSIQQAAVNTTRRMSFFLLHAANDGNLRMSKRRRRSFHPNKQTAHSFQISQRSFKAWELNAHHHRGDLLWGSFKAVPVRSPSVAARRGCWLPTTIVGICCEAHSASVGVFKPYIAMARQMKMKGRYSPGSML